MKAKCKLFNKINVKLFFDCNYSIQTCLFSCLLTKTYTIKIITNSLSDYQVIKSFMFGFPYFVLYSSYNCVRASMYFWCNSSTYKLKNSLLSVYLTCVHNQTDRLKYGLLP